MSDDKGQMTQLDNETRQAIRLVNMKQLLKILTNGPFIESMNSDLVNDEAREVMFIYWAKIIDALKELYVYGGDMDELVMISKNVCREYAKSIGFTIPEPNVYINDKSKN